MAIKVMQKEGFGMREHYRFWYEIIDKSLFPIIYIL